jgi:hypothetical protein
MSDLTDRIAAVLKDRYIRPVQDYDLYLLSERDAKELAAAVVEEFQLRSEDRHLPDGMGGWSQNYKTGEVTISSRPQTHQRRWVTGWDTINDPKTTDTTFTATPGRE